MSMVPLSHDWRKWFVTCVICDQLHLCNVQCFLVITCIASHSITPMSKQKHNNPKEHNTKSYRQNWTQHKSRDRWRQIIKMNFALLVIKEKDVLGERANMGLKLQKTSSEVILERKADEEDELYELYTYIQKVK